MTRRTNALLRDYVDLVAWSAESGHITTYAAACRLAAGEAAPGIALQIPPCTGAGKDCSALDPEGAVTLLPRTGPQPAPLPQTQHQAHHIPEPGTLALIGAGIASLLIWRTA